MSELPTQFMVQEPANLEVNRDELLSPELAKARLRVQTIYRFQALNSEIENIPDLQEQEAVRAKLDALATQELGKAWEVVKKPEVEVIPIMIGGKTKDELKQVLKVNGYMVTRSAEQMMDGPGFVTRPRSELMVFVRLSVRDLLGVASQGIGHINAAAKGLGLEPCPPEAGPWYYLHPSSQKNTVVGMLPIADDSDLCVFSVKLLQSTFWLFGYPAQKYWDTGSSFLFCLPDSRTENDRDTNE